MKASNPTVVAALALGLLTASAHGAETEALSVREVFASTPGQYQQPVRLEADITWFGYGFILGQGPLRLDIPTKIARRADVKAFTGAIYRAPNRGGQRLKAIVLVRLTYARRRIGPHQPRIYCVRSVELVRPLSYRELTAAEAGPAP